MARNLTGSVIAEIEAGSLRPILLVQMQFTSGVVYLWSGIGAISWNGQTWVGTGYLGKMEPLSETQDVEAQGVRFSLSGIPANLIIYALSEVRQGAPVIVYQGFLTAAGAVVSSPYQAWAGRMDSCQIEESGETSTIVISAESRLIDLHRSRERRYTHDDQQIDFPGDLGFEFVPALQELNLKWGGGAIPASRPSTGSSGGTINFPGDVFGGGPTTGSGNPDKWGSGGANPWHD